MRTSARKETKSKLLSAYKLLQGHDLEGINEEILTLGKNVRSVEGGRSLGGRLSFTDKGRALGCFPQVRYPSAKTVWGAHYHNFFELSFILEGEAKHRIGDNVYPVKPGDIVFLNNELPHNYVIGPKEKLTVLNIAFLPEFLESAITLDKLVTGVQFFMVEPFFRSLDDVGGKLTVTGDAFFRLATLALSIVDAFNRSYPAKSDLVPLLFKAFIISVNAAYEERVAERPRFYEKREALFREIVSFIDGRLSEKITLANIGTAVRLGRTQLAEIFKEKQGMTIVAYVNQRRVEQAQHLLRTTDMPILDIAFDTGFGDVSHFNHTFKRITGISPRQYRAGK